MYRPSGAALLNPNGKAPSAGEVFRNPDMAGVLRELGAGGKEGFYGGRIGAAIVKVLQQMGGVLTVEDLKVRLESRLLLSAGRSVVFLLQISGFQACGHVL